MIQWENMTFAFQMGNSTYIRIAFWYYADYRVLWCSECAISRVWVYFHQNDQISNLSGSYTKLHHPTLNNQIQSDASFNIIQNSERKNFVKKLCWKKKLVNLKSTNRPSVRLPVWTMLREKFVSRNGISELDEIQLKHEKHQRKQKMVSQIKRVVAVPPICIK